MIDPRFIILFIIYIIFCVVIIRCLKAIILKKFILITRHPWEKNKIYTGNKALVYGSIELFAVVPLTLFLGNIIFMFSADKIYSLFLLGSGPLFAFLIIQYWNQFKTP